MEKIYLVMSLGNIPCYDDRIVAVELLIFRHSLLSVFQSPIITIISCL